MTEAQNTDRTDSLPPVFGMLADLVQPVFDHWGREPSDRAIQDDIITFLTDAANSQDLAELRAPLSGRGVFWLGTLQFAFFYPDRGAGLSGSLRPYERWAEAKCSLLLAVLRATREDDDVIQHLLNYEDFAVEVYPWDFGRRFVLDVYESRGLDFFLFHYMERETTALSDQVMFEHADVVAKSLEHDGRCEEAAEVRKELRRRRDAIIKIGRDLCGPKYDQTAGATVERIRVAGERFWVGYLETPVWRALSERSREDLLDGFVSEYLLRRDILRGWGAAALSLCRVVERELGLALFEPWAEKFSVAEFIEPAELSNKQRRRVRTRRVTVEALRRSASSGTPPTLGELIYLARFWSDPLMDSCTSAFREIRSLVSTSFCDAVTGLVEMLELPLHRETGVTIPDLRNRAAHPGADDDPIDWPAHVEWLKEALGEPPRQILRTVALALRA